jgi:hypothetical protein
MPTTKVIRTGLPDTQGLSTQDNQKWLTPFTHQNFRIFLNSLHLSATLSRPEIAQIHHQLDGITQNLSNNRSWVAASRLFL